MAKKKKPEVKKSDILSRHIPDNCTVFVGIDPGFSGGALCKIKVSKEGEILSLDTTSLKCNTYGQVYTAVMEDLTCVECLVSIEEVNLQGKAAHAMDRLCKHAGACIAALDNINACYTTPAPSSWRSEMKLKVTKMTSTEKAEYLYAEAKRLTENKWDFPKYASDAVLLALRSYSTYKRLSQKEEIG